MRHSVQFLLPSLLAMSFLFTSVSAGFQLLTRYQNFGISQCNRRETCYCKYQSEHRLGWVPSSQNDCKTFLNDGNFENMVTSENGDEAWSTYSSICGSKRVDMRVVDGKMEVWEKGANPGKLLAKCNGVTNANKINCGNGGDPICGGGVTEVHPVWDCEETDLCK